MSSSPSPSDSNSSLGTGGSGGNGDYKRPRILTSWILAGLVFISGFVAMALEFAASRLLTPIFGSSISTWGVLIGIILAALTAGYHIGGRLADSKERSATIQRLCSVMFSSGLYILFIPLIIWPAIQESLASSPSIPMLVASTLLLIALPTVLMGFVSPYTIKLATTTLSTLGKKAGNLYSVATAGSIAGTFVTVFALIPSLEITAITFALGLALIIPAAVFLHRLPKFLAGSLVVLALVASTTPIDTGSDFLASLADLERFDASVNVAGLLGATIHREETPYSQLQVVDSATFSSSGAANSDSRQSKTRSLFLNGDLHSQMYIDYPYDLALLYTQFFPLGLVFNPDAKTILFVGGGGFSGPKYFLDAYPSIERVDVVEIDPVVIDVAKQYFGVDDSNPKLNIYNDDARRFLLANNGIDQEYDIIVLDAYSKNYVPFHLMTEEYFQLLNDHLAEDGVVVSNHIGPISQGITGADWGSAAYEKSKLWRAAYKTMAEVFPSMYVFPTRLNADGSVQNIMLVASKDEIVYDGNDIRQRQENVASGSNSIYNEDSQGTTNFLQTIDYANYLYNSTNIRTDDVPIFTDEYAPVEAFLSPLTNAQFNVTDDGEWEESVAANTRANIDSDQQPGAVSAATLVIAGIWVFHARRIWKKS